MASTSNSDQNAPEFHKFDNMLKIIPTCQQFVKDKAQLNVRPEGDWKKCVLTELDSHLPPETSSTQEVPHDTFFNCRKSVYKQCLAVITFSRSIAEIHELLQSINHSLFFLVVQHPRTGNIRRMEAFLMLALKLIEFLPWDKLDKRIGTKVMKNLDQMLKDLKTFRCNSDGLVDAAEKVGTSADKVFKHIPHKNFGGLMSNAHHPNQMMETTAVALAKKQTADTEVKLGLTQSNELLIGDGMVKIVKLSPPLQLGLLIMIQQRIKELLTTALQKLKRVLEQMKKASTPSKWTGITTMQLSIFETALLQKSQSLLVKSATDIATLAFTVNQQSKFLYEFRRPFKLLKYDLMNNSYDPIIENHFIMFQLTLEESRLKKYVESDCLNEDAAKFIITKFGE